MKQEIAVQSAASAEKPVSEILILPDGRILAHNISPAVARVLSDLDPADAAMKQRAIQKTNHEIPG